MSRQPIAVGSSEARSRPLMASRLLNVYTETPPQNSRAPGYGKVKAVQYGTPGLKTPIINTAGRVRAARFFSASAFPEGFIYVLIGGTLFQVSQNGVVIPCAGATIAPSGNAMITSNRTQLAVLSNGLTSIVSSTAPTVLAALTDPDYPTEGATSIDYVDGYGIWTRATTDQFFISAQNDFTDLDALDFATAESAPDGLVRVLVDHRIAWLFGTTTTEPWVNTGASPFPFERVPGALMERGCAAALSAAKLSESAIFWLGSDRVIYRNQGYQAVRISTPPVEEAIRVGTISDAWGLTYTMGGHQFYAVTFPSLNRTFVYDITTAVWHERQSGTTLTYAPWNVTCTVEAWGKIFAGTSDGKFGELDLDTYSDGGSAIRRAIRSAPFYAEGNRAILNSVEIEMELGTGISTGQGSDPQVMLRFSDDGGATWSNERSKSFGVTGERRKRVVFRNLGMFRQRMVEFAVSDPVKCSFYGMNYTGTELGA